MTCPLLCKEWPVPSVWLHHYVCSVRSWSEHMHVFRLFVSSACAMGDDSQTTKRGQRSAYSHLVDVPTPFASSSEANKLCHRVAPWNKEGGRKSAVLLLSRRSLHHALFGCLPLLGLLSNGIRWAFFLFFLILFSALVDVWLLPACRFCFKTCFIMKRRDVVK